MTHLENVFGHGGIRNNEKSFGTKLQFPNATKLDKPAEYMRNAVIFAAQLGYGYTDQS